MRVLFSKGLLFALCLLPLALCCPLNSQSEIRNPQFPQGLPRLSPLFRSPRLLSLLLGGFSPLGATTTVLGGFGGRLLSPRFWAKTPADTAAAIAIANNFCLVFVINSRPPHGSQFSAHGREKSCAAFGFSNTSASRKMACFPDLSSEFYRKAGRVARFGAQFGTVWCNR